MRAKTTTLLSMATLFVLAIAHAAPPAGGGRLGAGKGGDGDGPGPRPGMMRKVRPPATFGAARLAQTVKKNGETLTREQILAKFDADASLDLGNGSKITVQELMDRVDDAEKEVTTKGSSLTALKKTGWLRAATATKLATQQSLVPAEHQEVASKRLLLSAAGANSIFSCTQATCVPKDKEKTVKWEKSKGDEDTVAVYTSFVVTEQTPNANDAKCTATWDNGVQLMGDKHSLIKLTAEAAGSKRPTPTASGKAALYVLGQATPTWSKEGKVSGDNLDRTFKTPKAKLSVSFIPLVSVEGGIQAAATLSLKPTVSGQSDPTSAGCTLSMTPRITAEVDPEARIVVGIKRLVEIAEGGVKAQLVALDVSLPTTLGVKLTEQPMGLGLQFKSEVKASFLKGKVVAWYKIKDICAWGYCLIEDGLGIDTSGEIVLWKDDVGLAYTSTLVDFNGKVPLQAPGQSQITTKMQ